MTTVGAGGGSDERSSACKRLFLRLLLLSSISLIAVGPAEYDYPGAVSTYLEAPPLSTTGGQFAWLYSSYHLPNVALLLAGGAAIDFFGADAVALLCASLVIASAVVLAGGPTLVVLIASRTMLGSGAEVAMLATQALLVIAFDVQSESTLGASSRNCSTRCCTGPDIAVAFAVMEAVYFFAMLIVIDALPPLLRHYGWPGIISLLISMSLLMGLGAVGAFVMRRGYYADCSLAAAREPHENQCERRHGGIESERRPTDIESAAPLPQVSAAVPVPPPAAPPGIVLAALGAATQPRDEDEEGSSDGAAVTCESDPLLLDALPLTRSRTVGSATEKAALPLAVALPPLTQPRVLPVKGRGCDCTDDASRCLPAEMPLAPLLLHASFIVVFVTTSTPFSEFASSLITAEYGMTLERASYTRSVSKGLMIVTALSLGFALDAKAVSYHAVQLVGAVFVWSGFTMFAAAMPAPPEVAAAFVGLGMGAVMCAMWPLFNFRLALRLRGRVLGVLQSVINLVLVPVPLAIGVLRDRHLAAAAAAELIIPDPTATAEEVAARSHFAPAMYFLVAGQTVAVILALSVGLMDGWRVQRVAESLALAPTADCAAADATAGHVAAEAEAEAAAEKTL